ncbi:MAG: hypothetical protein ACLR70_03965 [Streptococcus thermophilus]
MDQSGRGDNDKVQKEFAEIQKSLKSHGYQAKSVNDIYHDEREFILFVFVVVNGGTVHLLSLEDSYRASYSGYH